jgi:hypothetical protein
MALLGVAFLLLALIFWVIMFRISGFADDASYPEARRDFVLTKRLSFWFLVAGGVFVGLAILLAAFQLVADPIEQISNAFAND